jgi:hypothetical protein
LTVSINPNQIAARLHRMIPSAPGTWLRAPILRSQATNIQHSTAQHNTTQQMVSEAKLAARELTFRFQLYLRNI